MQMSSGAAEAVASCRLQFSQREKLREDEDGGNTNYYTLFETSTKRQPESPAPLAALCRRLLELAGSTIPATTAPTGVHEASDVGAQLGLQCDASTATAGLGHCY